MSKVCDLLIDDTIKDAMTISNILASLPFDTEIVNIIKSTDSDHTIYRLEHHKFKHVDPWDNIPRVNVTTDGRTYWVEKSDLPIDSVVTAMPTPLGMLALRPSYTLNIIPPDPTLICIHSWTMYHGLINHYEYCKHCGDKK